MKFTRTSYFTDIAEVSHFNDIEVVFFKKMLSADEGLYLTHDRELGFVLNSTTQIYREATEGERS